MHKKSKNTPSSRKQYTFKRVSENLCKVIETGGYYALVKRGGKQIRRSLKTNDKVASYGSKPTKNLSSGNYILQYSNDLVNWQLLQEEISQDDAFELKVDPANDKAFYRLILSD